ncbi:MAG: anhydro-N-acetylmuramic acid kinase [Armatimonadota bacterium]
MSDPLLRIESGEPVLGIGLMSGTSADGIDAAAVALWREPGAPDRVRAELRAFQSRPYPAEVRELLFRCFANELRVKELCLLDARLGELFAEAAAAVAAEVGPEPPLAFVASHGQTVWHQPEAVPCGDALARGTLQLAEAARIAERLRVPVVSDFRQQDVAAGGQGAPLVPYVDYLLFGGADESRALQNLGGIGNVTYLRAGGRLEEVLAFDTGPANAWIDAAAKLVTGGRLACDLNGELAASAPVDAELLRRLLSEPYYSQPPPKSTGRELFTEGRVRELWDAGYRGGALVSTLTQLTVETVARAYRDWLGPVDAAVLGGGGARNPELVRRLRQALQPARVLLSEELGIDAEAKEGVAFAILGYQTLRGISSNVPSATGAARPVVQGKITLP